MLNEEKNRKELMQSTKKSKVNREGVDRMGLTIGSSELRSTMSAAKIEVD
jgi:hypothetical protein